MICTSRLMKYAALAAAIPSASAAGAIVASGPGPVGTATPGSPLLVDFGAGIGEVFRFDARFRSVIDGYVPPTTFTSSGYTYFFPGFSYSARSSGALFQFNPANTGGVPNAGVMANAPLGFPNDPRLLASGAPISAAQAFSVMTNVLGTSHDIARTTTLNGLYTTGYAFGGSTFYGDWRGGNRGFIGFTMQLAGAAHFGWLDVEYIPGLTARGVAGPSIIVHGWAYNDEPRGPIEAGEVPAPATFGLTALALGAAGVRRQRTAMAVARSN